MFEDQYNEFEALSVTERMAMIEEWSEQLDSHLIELRERTADLKAAAERMKTDRPQ